MPASTHTPAPLQLSARERTLPLQLAAAHVVPLAHSSHAPAPLHTPSVPQLVAALAAHSFCGSVPTTTAPHTPLVPPVCAAEQAMQVPAHGVLQQNPSTQLLLAHWLARPHRAPLLSVATQWPVASQ
jgi:hypothetical protein